MKNKISRFKNENCVSLGIWMQSSLTKYQNKIQKKLKICQDVLKHCNVLSWTSHDTQLKIVFLPMFFLFSTKLMKISVKLSIKPFELKR